MIIQICYSKKKEPHWYNSIHDDCYTDDPDITVSAMLRHDPSCVDRIKYWAAGRFDVPISSITAAWYLDINERWITIFDEREEDY